MEYTIMDGKGPEDTPSKSHYHGDAVRRLFITGGAVMMLTLPILKVVIPLPTVLSIFGILVVAIIAGLINPKQKWTSILSLIISIVAFFSFEYYAVITFSNATEFQSNVFFWINQALAVIFFISLYYSAKTLRGFYIEKI